MVRGMWDLPNNKKEGRKGNKTEDETAPTKGQLDRTSNQKCAFSKDRAARRRLNH